jgi:hypothetical protein
MIYPKHLTGPQFATSPLVTLQFNGARITLPVPEIPINDRMIDEVTRIRDFSAIDTSYWKDDGLGDVTENIIHQKWIFEDLTNWNNIASCHFKVHVVEFGKEQQQSHLVLNKAAFKQYLIDGFTAGLLEDEDKYLDYPDWPKAHNEFNYQCISNPELDWFQIQFSFMEGKLSPWAFIPINSRFALTVRFIMATLHDEVRVNPYSDELISKLQFDLFAEYMQLIDLQYSEETLAIVRQVNSPS